VSIKEADNVPLPFHSSSGPYPVTFDGVWQPMFHLEFSKMSQNTLDEFLIMNKSLSQNALDESL
jgi:hypothetical protein